MSTAWLKEADALKAKGNEAFMSGNTKKAVEFYGNALQKFPPSDTLDGESKKLAVALRSNRAQCLLNMGKAGKARQDAEIAIALDSTHVKSYYRLAFALNELNERSRALEVCTEGLSVDATNQSLIDLSTQLKEAEAKLQEEIAASASSTKRRGRRGADEDDESDDDGIPGFYSNVRLPKLHMDQILPVDVEAVKHLEDQHAEETGGGSSGKKEGAGKELEATTKTTGWPLTEGEINDMKTHWGEEQGLGCPPDVVHEWVNGPDVDPDAIPQEPDFRVCRWESSEEELKALVEMEETFSEELHLLNRKTCDLINEDKKKLSEQESKAKFMEGVRAAVYGWDMRNHDELPDPAEFLIRTALLRVGLNDYPVWVYFGEKRKFKEVTTEPPFPVYLEKLGPFTPNPSDPMSSVNRCDVFRSMYFAAARTKYTRKHLEDVRTLYRMLRDFGTARIPQKLDSAPVPMSSERIEQQLIGEFCDVNAEWIKKSKTLMKTNPRNRIHGATWTPNDFLLRQKELLDEAKKEDSTIVYIFRNNLGFKGWMSIPLSIPGSQFGVSFTAKIFKQALMTGNKSTVTKLFGCLNQAVADNGRQQFQVAQEQLAIQLAVEFDMTPDEVQNGVKKAEKDKKTHVAIEKRLPLSETKQAEYDRRCVYPGAPKWIDAAGAFHKLLTEEWRHALNVKGNHYQPISRADLDICAYNLKMQRELDARMYRVQELYDGEKDKKLTVREHLERYRRAGCSPHAGGFLTPDTVISYSELYNHPHFVTDTTAQDGHLKRSIRPSDVKITWRCQTCDAHFKELRNGPRYPVDGEDNEEFATTPPPLPSRDHLMAGLWSKIDDGCPQCQCGEPYCTDACHKEDWEADHKDTCEGMAENSGFDGAFALTRYYWNLVVCGAIPYPGEVDWVAAWEEEKKRTTNKSTSKKVLLQQELNFYLKYQRAAMLEAAVQAQNVVKKDPTSEVAITELFEVLTSQFLKMATPLVRDSPSRLRFKLCMVSTLGNIITNLVGGAMGTESDSGPMGHDRRRQELRKAVVTRQTKKFCDIEKASKKLLQALEKADSKHDIKKMDFPSLDEAQLSIAPTAAAAPPSITGGHRHVDPTSAAADEEEVIELSQPASGGSNPMLSTDARNFFYSV